MQRETSIGSASLQQWLQEIDLGMRPSTVIPALPQSRISLLRWQCDRGNSKILKARPLESDYRISLLLAPLSTRIWSNGEPVWEGELEAGHFRICPPGTASEWSRHSSCDIVNVFLPKRLVQALCVNHVQPSIQVDEACERESIAHERPLVCLPETQYRHDPFVSAAIAQLISAQRNTSHLSRLSCDHLALALAAHLVAQYNQPIAAPKAKQGQVPSNYFRMHSALSYMEEHLSEDLKLSQIAAYAGMSASHFAREFAASFGQTPHRYLLQRRLETAREKLMNTQLPVTDLAMDLGFHDASHLSRAFTQQFGMSPSAFRRRHCQN